MALHGWLDNAASFIPVAPFLQDFRLIAIDLPGHGLSSHVPQGCYFHFVDLAATVVNVMDALKWKQCSLIGHSLGAGVASIVAGVIPERIQALGLIDGIGPLTVSEEQTPDMIRKSISEYQQLPNKKLTLYASKDDAIEARLAVSKMERSSVQLLVERGVKRMDNSFNWRTDPRLMLKPLSMFSENQATEFLKKISSKTCLVRPSTGWPFDGKVFSSRINYLQNIEVHRISGNHHVHMDNPEIVGPILNEFYKRILK